MNIREKHCRRRGFRGTWGPGQANSRASDRNIAARVGFEELRYWGFRTGEPLDMRETHCCQRGFFFQVWGTKAEGGGAARAATISISLAFCSASAFVTLTRSGRPISSMSDVCFAPLNLSDVFATAGAA